MAFDILGGTSVKNAGGLLGLGKNLGVQKPDLYGPDFPDGLELVEYVNGVAQETDAIKLVGRFMPHIPFEFGGSQKLIREDYPGSSEPTVQVLGPREDNMSVKGELKTNKFKDVSLRNAAEEYQRLIDAMRIRGNLVRLSLGTWHRYGFIEKTVFKMNRLQDIEYQIDFMIVGFNPPKKYKIIDGRDDDLIAPNKEITNKAAAALAAAANYPSQMPLSTIDVLTRGISDVASKVNRVTGFVTGIVSDAKQLIGSANRAIGLIKNARATISAVQRDLAGIKISSLAVVGINGQAGQVATRTSAAIRANNLAHIHQIQRDFGSLAALLASMQAQFAKLANNTPQFRHLVRNGDTLQTVAQKYYQSSDNWKSIYDHNNLTTTVLKVGTVLEIPRLT